MNESFTKSINQLKMRKKDRKPIQDNKYLGHMKVEFIAFGQRDKVMHLLARNLLLGFNHVCVLCVI